MRKAIMDSRAIARYMVINLLIALLISLIEESV